MRPWDRVVALPPFLPKGNNSAGAIAEILMDLILPGPVHRSSVCSELKELICTSKSVSAMLIHSQLPEAPVDSQQARWIRTWWAMKKRKDNPWQV